jgi:hypothetical protein
LKDGSTDAGYFGSAEHNVFAAIGAGISMAARRMSKNLRKTISISLINGCNFRLIESNQPRPPKGPDFDDLQRVSDGATN